ncbi:hypothetical protein QQS21_010683 [Conoideocrella luteorostrata]|uniref:Uncharacterized protein n=1 Tax=Conoideocrella luteorostrata TaxID=1105319 RepID=A0AAJ0FTZ0_9HYPO|nr:hypothetical protein QQS21_010683 [Conoideocrella luteorostrata]
MATASGSDLEGRAIVAAAPLVKPIDKSVLKREAAASSTYSRPYLKFEGSLYVSHDGPDAKVSVISKMQMFEERAKKMCEKYGMIVKASDFFDIAPDETVLRVEKPIKMRIRRTCHKCNATFSTKSECASCQHTRCDLCPRYPPKVNEAEFFANLAEMEAVVKTNRENSAISADLFWGDQKIELTRPSKSGGQDLVHRKPRQRVRRTCHECTGLFASGSKKCDCCGHIRCTDCPRDPPKKDMYPFGYPGDAFGPKTDARFECLCCKTLYPPEAEDGTLCASCGLEKSGESPRAMPRKVQPVPDPDVLNKLQAKLTGLSPSSSSPSL